MAAGLSLREEHLADFRRRFGAHMLEAATGNELQPRLSIDTEASFSELTLELLDSYELLRPFGNSNPQPVFISKQVQLLAEPRVLKERHLKFRLSQAGVVRDAIFFNGVDHDLPRPPWDIAFTILRNEFRGRVSLQMNVKAVRSAEES